jgi:hypothetical protein
MVGLLIALAWVGSATAVLPSPGSPEAVGQSFYAWVLAHPSSGLPRGKALNTIRPLLSARLVKLIHDATVAEDGYAKATARNEKPPMFDGDVFVDNLEGASEVDLGKVELHDAVARVESRLLYIDARFPKAHPYRAVAWTDHLLLVRENEHWLVDDIVYGADDAGKTLVGILQKFVDEYQHSPGKV